MATYDSPADVAPLQKVRSASLNNLDAAVAAAFARLPHEDELTGGIGSWGTDTGTANTYLVELPYPPSSYVDGLEVSFRPLNTNTGASTINVNSLGVKNVKRSGDLELYAGDLSIGLPVQLRFSTATDCFHFVNTIVREASVSGNEADIATNAADIAANVIDTATNTSGVATNAITTANFNTRNDRDNTAITLPTIGISGGAVDHTLNTDGSADISLDWTWVGTETDIDGFIIYVRGSTSSASYNFGTTPAEEVTFHCMADRRSFILKGIGADLHWTWGVSAYRIVDPDVAAVGKLASAVVQPSLGSEDPYQPSANIAFGGDITGTVNSQAVSGIIYHNGTKLVKTDDSGVDADDLDESVTKKWAAESGADVTATSTFVTVTYPADQTDIQTQIDGKIVSWFQSGDPQPTWEGTDASHNGDMWWNTSTKKLKRWSESTWSSEIEDQKTIDAYTNAATAQDTADGKRRVFTATPTTPYDIGDLWVGGPSGDIKRCSTARASGAYQAGDWELASNYDETATHIAQNLIYNGDFELDASGTADPTYWDRTIGGTPYQAIVWATTPEAFWPPWKPGGHCFYANCDDAAEYVGITSNYYIPISQNSFYCLSAWVKTSNSKCYLGIHWYDKNHVSLSYDYICMDGYEATHAWEQKSSAAFKPSDYEATARYAKIRCYPQYEKIGYTMISRIQFVESKTSVAWEISYAVAPGSDKTGDNTAADAAAYTGASISTTKTDAKCTVAAADETSANNQGVSWLNEAVGSVLPVANTDAKCTNSLADQTSINTAADITGQGNLATQDVVTANQVNTATISAIVADLGSMTAGTITGALIRTASGTTRVELNSSDNRLNIYNSGTNIAYFGKAGAGHVIYMNYPDAGNNTPIYLTSDGDEQNIVTILDTSTTTATNAPPLNVRCDNDDKYAAYLRGDSTGVVSSLYVSQLGTGYIINTNVAGCYCTKAGVWHDASSSGVKENFEDIEILAYLNSLPIKKYNYISEKRKTRDELRIHLLNKWKRIKYCKTYEDEQEPSQENIGSVQLEFTELQKVEKEVDKQYPKEIIRSVPKHVSPMAEDLFSVFGIGNDKSISPKDLAGVALQAVKELSAKVEALEIRIKQLEKQ